MKDSSLNKAIFRKDSYQSDLEEDKPQLWYQSKPKNIKKREDSKIDVSRRSNKFECSFGAMNMPLKKVVSHPQTFDGRNSKNSKLSQMLKTCAENSQFESEKSSSLTPVEENDVPMPFQRPSKEKTFKSLRKSAFEKSKPQYERISYRNKWSSYGSSFTEFPSHLFKPPSKNEADISPKKIL